MFFCFKNKTKQKKAIFSVCILPFPKTLKTPSPKHSKFLFSEVSPLLFQGLGGESGLPCGLGRSLREIQVGQKGPGVSAVVQLPCNLWMGSVDSYRAKGTCQMRSVLSVSLQGAGRPLRPPGALPK